MLKIKSKTKDTITFLISPIPYANALRRILISELPSLAIDQIEISQNTGVLPDEVIAHRLAMLPVFSENADSLLSVDQCLCKTLCDKCSIIFQLNVSANTSNAVIASGDETARLDVFANSLKAENSNNLFSIN
ncbi:DNA-directed RNA polymerase II subunit RPB3 [Cucumispora dikerogammari]|nr:DNA-directed RNA polymerase II subunit RPB3 [Cucumispora dikerogammari]